jgi:hypothetical protein
MKTVYTVNNKIFSVNNKTFSYELWTPSLITTNAWYDASDANTITESGGVVSQWSDKSPSSNHMTQSIGGNSPSIGTQTLNGLNVVTLNGSSQYMSFTSGFNINQCVIFVFAPNSDNINQRIFNNSTAPAVQMGYNGGNNKLTYTGTGISPIYGLTFASTATYDKPSPYIAGWGFESNGIREEKDGTNILYPITKLSTSAANAVTFGRQDTPVANYFNGYFAEIIAIPDYTLGEGRKIEGYLAWKWGMVNKLPSDHPYKNARPLA